MAYTEYSIHWVQHTLSTAYTEYGIHRILRHPMINCLLLPASLSSRCRSCRTQLFIFPQLQVNQWIESQLPARLPTDLLAPEWPPRSTPPFLDDHVLQKHLWSRSITASKRISKHARLGPLSLYHDGLQVHLQTGAIMASKFISKLAQSQPPSASSDSLDQSLQEYLQSPMLTASKLGPSRHQVYISYCEMMSIYPGVSQIYTACHWIHLRYPSIPLCIPRET